jgi:hypothetical protein
MTEVYIKETIMSKVQPCLSIRDYKSAIDKYKDIQNSNTETHIQFGSDSGGLTSYEYYKSKENTIHIITKYVGRFVSHSIVETEWIESMELFMLYTK